MKGFMFQDPGSSDSSICINILRKDSRLSKHIILESASVKDTAVQLILKGSSWLILFLEAFDRLSRLMGVRMFAEPGV